VVDSRYREDHAIDGPFRNPASSARRPGGKRMPMCSPGSPHRGDDRLGFHRMSDCPGWASASGPVASGTVGSLIKKRRKRMRKKKHKKMLRRTRHQRKK